MGNANENHVDAAMCTVRTVWNTPEFEKLVKELENSEGALDRALEALEANEDTDE